jgi:hypothetical protein
MSEEDTLPPVFRPSKRRKVIRPRRASVSPDPQPTSTQPQDQATSRTNEDDEPPQADSEALASALRARNRIKGRRRGGGIPISVRDEPAGSMSNEVAVLAQDAEEEEGGIFSTRFARPTGVVADVMDKAM